MKPRQSLAEKAKAFLARHGATADDKSIAAVSDLLSDVQRLRERVRTAESGETPYKPDARVADLERENADLEKEVDRLSGLIPATGTVVLSGDDAKAWPEYKALGTVADLKKQVDELPTLRTKVSDAETSTAAKKAAAALGWNDDATTAMINDKKLVLSFVAGKDAKNQDIQIPHVRPAADEKAAPKPLADWQKENAGYMTAALATKGTTPTPDRSFTPLPITTPGSTPAAPGDAVAEFAKRSQAARDSRANPLIPRPATAAAS